MVYKFTLGMKHPVYIYLDGDTAFNATVTANVPSKRLWPAKFKEVEVLGLTFLLNELK